MKLEALLHQVEKPSRYIGGEINTFNKEISDDEMSRLLLEAQRQTRALAEKGLIKNDPYRGLPDEYRGDSDSNYNDLAMDFLDELNDW